MEQQLTRHTTLLQRFTMEQQLTGHTALLQRRAMEQQLTGHTTLLQRRAMGRCDTSSSKANLSSFNQIRSTLECHD